MLGRLAWLLQNVKTKSPLSYLRLRILPIVMYLIAKEKDDHETPFPVDLKSLTSCISPTNALRLALE